MVEHFGGAIVDTAGDGILAAFPSVVRAVECAVAIQATMDERNRAVPEERRMRFRIGVNLGDVIDERRDLRRRRQRRGAAGNWPSRAASAFRAASSTRSNANSTAGSMRSARKR